MFWVLDPSDVRTKDRIASVVDYVEALQSEVRMADGRLVRDVMTKVSFHVGALWMQVAPDTVFHKWLASGAGKRATIVLTTDTSRMTDAKNARLLTGTLVHCTAPGKTPVIHTFMVKDHVLGVLGQVTFQTTDNALAAKFAAHDGANFSLVLSIKQ
jgi:hypothetical protein